MTAYSAWLQWWWLIPLALMVACLIACTRWWPKDRAGSFYSCGCLPQEHPDRGPDPAGSLRIAGGGFSRHWFGPKESNMTVEEKDAGGPRKEAGLKKRVQAIACHYCPLCRQARKKPDSRLGRFMHGHHAENCPVWQAHQELYE